MKKLLLLTVFSLHVFHTQAQSWVYHPFPTDSAVWINTKGTWQIPPGWPTVPFPAPYVMYDAPDRYCMSTADTMIGSVNYSQLHRCGATYCGGLRDDGAGKVYFIPADSTNELLVYDFTVQAGDSAVVYENYGSGFTLFTYYNAGIDSTLINGSYRKRISFSGSAYWIEGIGCTQGLFRESWPNVGGWYTNLECMSKNNTSIYPVTASGPCSLTSGIEEETEHEIFVDIFPNPSSGKFFVRWSAQARIAIEIYDVLGKVVQKDTNATEVQFDLSDRPNGIYFIRLTDQKGNVISKKVIKQ
ncbi:MAG: T9SS type A sorting domain-containing protein [Bacteroidetes bacterium]|nr:T9SS type A sorting domain-containing protein [Bacteroidota bacterium]